MKRAIVLSGGGARGAYQMGAWKALKKLHIKYDIVAGTSVGSLNGALMTQRTYLKGIWFWHNINFKNIFKDEILSDYKTPEGRKAIFRQFAKAIFSSSGMDVTKLEENIEKVLDEKKVRKSKIDFGLVTFNLSTLKPIKLTKKDIPVGELKDYLMASATCFPAFKKKRIGEDDYIDGGYYDNLPINLAVDMGATEVIAIDLRSIGLRQHLKYKNINITYIAPRNNLGSFLVFHKDLARRGIRLGYNDTMKTYDRLDGNKFTFKHNHLSNNFNHYKDTYQKILDCVFQEMNKGIMSQVAKIRSYKTKLQAKDMNRIIEYLGKSFKIDDSYIYDIEKFNKMLICKLDEMSLVDRKLVEQKIKKKDLKNLLNNSFVIKYIYDKIALVDDIKIKKEISNIALLLPKEIYGALYLYVIKNNH